MSPLLRSKWENIQLHISMQQCCVLSLLVCWWKTLSGPYLKGVGVFKYVTVTKVSFWVDAGSTRTGTYTPPQIKLLKVVVMQKCSLQWNWIILKETVIRKFFLHQQLLSTWSKCWELELIPTNQLWFHYFTLPQVQRRNIWTTNWIILSLWNLPFSEQSKSLPGIPVSNQQRTVVMALASS